MWTLNECEVHDELPFLVIILLSCCRRRNVLYIFAVAVNLIDIMS